MRKRKYQVFVSSTYEDLIEERKEVTQALLENECIPVGMELFPASNKKQWDIIKSVIDDSDYYLLIIAGRYGSCGKDDLGNIMSYTEMEYDYAYKIGKPILVFQHNDIGMLSLNKSEKTKSGRQRLNRFREKTSDNREVAYWTNKDNLKSKVIFAIRTLIKDYPSGGWVKAGSDIDQMPVASNDFVIDNLSGHWKSITEQDFEDEGELSYNSFTHMISGTINRIKPDNQNKRKWKCFGCVVGDTFALIYYSHRGHSAGCALLRHYYESEYRGKYLRFDYGTGKIDQKAITLIKQ